MSYIAQELITRSLYLSQIVARDLQTPSASQISDGLFLLNELLDFKSTDIRLIPYFQEYDFNTVQGQELYFVPNLLYVDTMTFDLQTVRYSLTEMTRSQYFSTPRVEGIQSLPFSYRVERKLDGSNVYLYFVPSQVYLIKLWGKFGLTEVALNTDMSLTYDAYYLGYLRYELANFFCAEWGTTFPEQAKIEYNMRRKKLMEVSPPDLSIRKQTYFNGAPPLDWQTVNLSEGFFPF
jgi:hypothetical protein